MMRRRAPNNPDEQDIDELMAEELDRKIDRLIGPVKRFEEYGDTWVAAGDSLIPSPESIISMLNDLAAHIDSILNKIGETK